MELSSSPLPNTTAKEAALPTQHASHPTWSVGAKPYTGKGGSKSNNHQQNILSNGDIIYYIMDNTIPAAPVQNS